jgi:heptaprenylglyceryl phosphate synthase
LFSSLLNSENTYFITGIGCVGSQEIRNRAAANRIHYSG